MTLLLQGAVLMAALVFVARIGDDKRFVSLLAPEGADSIQALALPL